MQSFETCGFRMDFEDNNNNYYLELKDAIERLCSNSQIFSTAYERNPLVHYLSISKETCITCAVVNQKVEFAIYKKKTNELIQHINKNTYVNIAIEDVQELGNRMERIAKYPTHMKPEPLYGLWMDLLKEKEIQKENIESYER